MTTWKVGDSASLSKTVTTSDLQGLAEITLDNNPIHLDAEYAASTIFRGVIAHGLLSEGVISAVLGTKLPGPGAIYRSKSVKFHLPVRVGDVITATNTVTSFEKGVMVLESIVTNQKGEIVVSATVEVGYRPEKFRVA